MEGAKQLRERLHNGRPLLGVFSKTCDPAMIEVLGHAGFHYVILDCEHGPSNPMVLQNLIRAAEVAGIAPIVRVASIDEEISRALDVGAIGVEIPKVETAEDARRAIQAAKFYPEGERGVCRFVRAAGYSSTPKERYFQEANENFVVLQLEGTEAVSNIDTILKTPGIDVIFVGPYDLSQSLGLTGQVTHPLVEEKMKEIILKCREKGVAAGTFCDTIENARKWMAVGVQYIAFSVDVGIFYEACRESADALLQGNAADSSVRKSGEAFEKDKS